jgi:UDP-N-acetylmuramate dehydrogenase
LPNCGSVFLNDPEIYPVFGAPGKVIEDTGLKGLRCGAMEVSPLHANFMVNHGGGSSADVFALIRQVRNRVHDRTGRWLRCEVRYLAPDTRLLAADEVLAGGEAKV